MRSSNTSSATEVIRPRDRTGSDCPCCRLLHLELAWSPRTIPSSMHPGRVRGYSEGLGYRPRVSQLSPWTDNLEVPRSAYPPVQEETDAGSRMSSGMWSGFIVRFGVSALSGIGRDSPVSADALVRLTSEPALRSPPTVRVEIEHHDPRENRDKNESQP